MSELLPAKYISVEYVGCTDPSRQYEFNRWYGKVHIPALTATPGILSAHFYRNVARELREGQPGYMTLCRIDSEDPWGLMQEVMKSRTAMHDCFHSYGLSVWGFLAYRCSVRPLARPETHLPGGMPEGMLLVPTLCTDPSREAEFNDWYLNTHFHDLLETPGLVQAHRYRTLKPDLADDDPRYLALYEIDSDDPGAVVRQILDDDRNIRIPQGRMINCIRATYGFATYQHVDT